MGDIDERRMPGSRTPVFGEVEDFQAVLSAPGPRAELNAITPTGSHDRCLARLSEVRRATSLLGGIEFTCYRLILHSTSLPLSTNGVYLKLTSNVVDLTINPPMNLTY